MHLNYCKKCRAYTLKSACPKCSKPTVNPHPARFSPEDRLGIYRRKLKLEMSERGENV